jgi:hypothetical protein
MNTVGFLTSVISLDTVGSSVPLISLDTVVLQFL